MLAFAAISAIFCRPIKPTTTGTFYQRPGRTLCELDRRCGVHHAGQRGNGGGLAGPRIEVGGGFTGAEKDAPVGIRQLHTSFRQVLGSGRGRHWSRRIGARIGISGCFRNGVAKVETPFCIRRLGPP